MPAASMPMIELSISLEVIRGEVIAIVFICSQSSQIWLFVKDFFEIEFKN